MPNFAIGTVGQIADELERRRDELGFSYVVVGGECYEAMAPVVERLAGGRKERVESTELSIDTSRRQLTDLTVEIAEFCRSLGDGLLSVFVPHATAGLALMETGSGSEADLEELLGGCCPATTATGTATARPATAPTTSCPALVSPSLVIPVAGGRMQLGTWQSVVLVDPNSDNPRRTVRLSFLAG